MSVDDAEPPVSARPTGRPGHLALTDIETLDSAAPARPQPETPVPPVAALVALPPAGRGRGRWAVGAILAGGVGLIGIGIAQWVMDLLDRMPVLGVPAAIAAMALTVGAVGFTWREVAALRRLRDVEQVRGAWDGADGEHLRRLILRVGTDLRETAGARQAADLIDDSGPVAARRRLSRTVLAPRDRLAGDAIAAAARQGFVLVTASPSPALDSLLLIARAAQLLRQIASAYGYRPGTLALRGLALAAGRDAGAVAVADALAQAAAEGASHSLSRAGDAATAVGAAAAGSGVGAVIGLPLAAAGIGLSVLGRAVGVTGGAVGGGAAAAWRLYRFGLMVLVASRPLPFDAAELAELKASTRAEILRIGGARRDAENRDAEAAPVG